MTEPQSALSGMTVVDMSAGYAGALASMFLSDNGARVVRVAFRDADIVRAPDIFALYDRGKEVARLDRDDTAALRDLYSVSDAVIDDFPSSPTTERARLGLDTLTEVHPRIVHCSITAYGARGPLRDEPADHDLAAARAGVLASQPSYRGGPIHVAHPVAYIGAGLLAATGICAALYHRENSGHGRRVRTSLMAGALLYTPKAASDNIPVRRMNMTPQGGGPFYSVFECADGRWIQIGCIHSGFVDLAAAVIGVVDVIAADPRFGDGRWPRDEDARRELFDIVQQRIRTRPSHEWIDDLQAADVPCTLTQTAEDAMRDPQILHNALVHQLEDPIFGPTRMAGLPINLSATPGRIHAPRAAAPNDAPDTALTDSQTAEPSPISEADSNSNSDELPLVGVRVMEMTNVIAGPVAGRLLADLGAESIKFESLDGDISRPAGGAGFIAFNANKRSVSANTRADAGKAIARRIAAVSDVILSNMRPGAIDRTGLDTETLSSLNPNIIQTHITAYGWDGPYSQRPGVDPIAQAITGLQHAQGGYDAPPVYLSMLAPCDYTGGALGALGTVIALLARARFGAGQKVDTNLMAAGVIVNADGFLDYEGKRPRRLPDPDQMGIDPLRRLYRVSDGWIYIAADGVSPLPDADILADILDETKLAASSANDALAMLTAHGIPCAPVVADYAQGFFHDPQTRANRMTAEIQHPTLGIVRLSGNLVSFDGADSLPKLPTPLLGQHTAETLSKVGFSELEIAALYRDGVIVTEPVK